MKETTGADFKSATDSENKIRMVILTIICQATMWKR